MELGIKEEVKNIEELKVLLKDNKEISKDYQVAVIVYAFDEENRIIFQRRGMGCRDERLKLETIGGRVKENDIDFRNALNREIEEEIGTAAKIELEEYVTSTYAVTFDNRYNKQQAWIYILYKGSLKSGELKIAGYERYKIGEVDENELSNGSRELYKIVCKKYDYLK